MDTQDELKTVVGGDGLVDGETTYGEDIKGNSTHDVAPVVEAPAEAVAEPEVAAEVETPEEDVTEPVAETETLVEDVAEPAEEAVAPVEETAAPAEEQPVVDGETK